VDRLLALFDQAAVAATFFVLGEVAALHTAMVRTIAELGHEVACHGYRHDLVSQMSPRDFQADVHKSRLLLEDLTGRKVIGYRAPSFSIGERQAWAYDILLEEGFRYDSSLYPIRHDLYGDPYGSRVPFEIRRNGSNGLLEVPIGTARFFSCNLPIGGGGYFRLLPLSLTRVGIRRVNCRERRPVVFYLHPWELDPLQPRQQMPWYYSFRHYVGLSTTEKKLSALLQSIPFGTIRDTLSIHA
jgi:polysaccharide deacetylase family protein (PEP-CTERM system associated)